MDAAWSEGFALMWEAYRAGTIPVGAVLVDEDGAIVSRGRNRILDAPFGGQLAGTRLAHAEINALLALPVDRRYEGFTLYSTLEPCHLCLSAVVTSRVGTVRYAGADPYGGGVGKLVAGPDHDAHPVVVEGPLPGAEGLLPELLHVAHMLWRLPGSNVVRFYEAARPEVLAAAAELPPPDADASFEEVAAQARAAAIRSGAVGWEKSRT